MTHQLLEPLASEWSAAIDSAMRDVFCLMVASEIVPSALDCQPSVPEHTAMVGLAGVVCGVITIRCSSGSAALIASRMLALPLEEAAEQSRDALGEVCNMVAGAFKNQIRELERDCLLSVPTVVTGSDYQMQSLAQGELIRRNFLLEGQPITVSLQTHHRNNPS